MITKIAIKNFKGIGERVEVELRPLTLLFGPNSAGKSSILHALHYAREIFERQNTNPDRTIAGGGVVDLGGFPAFVHNHDLGQEVEISIELDLRGIGLPGYASPHRGEYFTDDVIQEISTAELSVRTGYNHLSGNPDVREYSVRLDDQWICSLDCQPTARQGCLKINTQHHRLARIASCADAGHMLHKALAAHEDFRMCPTATNVTENDSVMMLSLALAKDSDLLPVQVHDGVAQIAMSMSVTVPPWHSQALALPFNENAAGPIFDPSGDKLHLSLEQQALDDDPDRAPEEMIPAELTQLLTRQLNAGLTEIVIGPCRRAYEAFQNFRYVGPLRETPPRTYLPPRYPDPSRWSCGLGAWDELHTGNSELIQAVSRWLGDRERLDAGYRIERKEYKEVDLNDPIVADFLVGKHPSDTSLKARVQINQLPTQAKLVICPNGSKVGLSPHDVGVGISQVIPVVVTALADREHLLVIEQPELHLHPRLQANLGDLFIEAAVGERKQTVVLETHSEHLLLRLLRRIRETSEGTLPDGCQSLKPDQLAVVYIESIDGSVRVTRLHVTEDGDFAGSWPAGFFDERAKELF